jgi:hypothetical protein
MKCENCPFLGLEGVENDLSWCKLYSAEAPVNGCEYERDTIVKQQEMMQTAFKKTNKR